MSCGVGQRLSGVVIQGELAIGAQLRANKLHMKSWKRQGIHAPVGFDSSSTIPAVLRQRGTFGCPFCYWIHSASGRPSPDHPCLDDQVATPPVHSSDQ
jgi:hypothetical protein